MGGAEIVHLKASVRVVFWQDFGVFNGCFA